MNLTDEHSDISISLVGYGRLAKHLVPALKRAGIRLKQWYIRNEKEHARVAHEFDITPVRRVTQLNEKSDVVLLMVNDQAIQDVANDLPQEIGIVCHTSGMTPMDTITSSPRGVFYPLNTFNGTSTDWDPSTPIFIQGSDSKVVHTLEQIGRKISHHVRTIDHEQLQYIHLAAVLSQNFSNHLIAQAEEILKQHHIDREVLHPLLTTMIGNLKMAPARSNQTGPAIRGDSKTMDEQRHLLANNPELKKLYSTLSNLIQTTEFH